MIKNILMGVAPKYQYIIKMVGVDKQFVRDTVEQFMSDYKILSISVKETPIQRTPLDFEKFTNSSVVIASVTTAYPVSADYALELLSREAKLPMSMIVVRHAESPLELQNAARIKAENKEKKTLLSCDPAYHKEEETPPGEDYVGNAYTNKLLQVMKKLRDEKPTVHKLDAPSPLFSWMEMDKVADQEPVQDKTNINTQGKVGKIANTLNTGVVGD